jgi:hypothetical protein
VKRVLGNFVQEPSFDRVGEFIQLRVIAPRESLRQAGSRTGKAFKASKRANRSTVLATSP